jgi:hypothetical protein
MDHMEHRWGERLKVDLPVRIWTAYGNVGAGEVLDLSVSGAFIRTRLQIPLLSPLNVAFRSRRHSGRLQDSATYVAHVVRREESGIGIEWFDFATEDVVAVTHADNRSLLGQQALGLASLSPPQARKLRRGAKPARLNEGAWLPGAHTPAISLEPTGSKSNR